MANIESQIKRIRTNEKRNENNKSYKSYVKTVYNKTKQGIVEHADNVKTLIAEYCSAVDKAVSKGIFHHNKGANKKSKIMNLYNKSLADKTQAN